MELIKCGIYTHDDGFIFTVIDESESEYFIAIIDEDFTNQKDVINAFHLNLNDTSDWIWFINKNTIQFFNRIDGYLGKITDDLLNELTLKLHQMDWW